MDLELTYENFDEPEPGYLLGSVFINGVLHHIEAVRVSEDASGNTHIPAGDLDRSTLRGRSAMLDRLYEMDDMPGKYQTVEIIGKPGRYLVSIIPSK